LRQIFPGVLRFSGVEPKNETRCPSDPFTIRIVAALQFTSECRDAQQAFSGIGTARLAGVEPQVHGRRPQRLCPNHRSWMSPRERLERSDARVHICAVVEKPQFAK
jgi:hypothetical protein